MDVTTPANLSLELEIALAIKTAIDAADPDLSAEIVAYSSRRGEPSHTLSVAHTAGGRGGVTVTPWRVGPYVLVACEGLPSAVAAVVWAAVAKLGSEHGHRRLHHSTGFYGQGTLRVV